MEQFEYDQITSYKPYTDTSYDSVKNIHNNMKQKKITNLVFKHPVYEPPKPVYEEDQKSVEQVKNENNKISEFTTPNTGNEPSNNIKDYIINNSDKTEIILIVLLFIMIIINIYNFTRVQTLSNDLLNVRFMLYNNNRILAT